MLEEQRTSGVATLQEQELSLIEVTRIILKRKGLIASLALVATVIATGLSFLLPDRFTATATLLPVEKSANNNFAAIASSLGGGLGMFAPAGLMGRGATDKFETILRTRTLTEKVITRHDLMPVIFEKHWDPARKAWKTPKPPTMQAAVQAMKKSVLIESEKKSGVISISYTATDPEMAARISNAYAEELEDYLKSNTLSTVKRNRLFIEEQLDKNVQELNQYESALKNFHLQNKIVSLDAQTQASIKAYADLKARLVSAEVDLKLLQRSSLPGDPKVQLKEQEVAELKLQLSKIENASGDGPTVTFQKAPELGLSQARIERELAVRRKVFELLTQQLEMAKIQEAQEEASFQVLDAAIPPEKKSGPKRAIIVVIALLASTVLGTILAYALEWRNRSNSQPSNSNRVTL